MKKLKNKKTIMNTFLVIALIGVIWILEKINGTLNRIENKLDEIFPVSDDISI
jgi:hypothetical protein